MPSCFSISKTQKLNHLSGISYWCIGKQFLTTLTAKSHWRSRLVSLCWHIKSENGFMWHITWRPFSLVKIRKERECLLQKLAKFTIMPRGLTLPHISVYIAPCQCISHWMEMQCNAMLCKWISMLCKCIAILCMCIVINAMHCIGISCLLLYKYRTALKIPLEKH